MPDVMIIARFRPSAYFALGDNERGQARAAAQRLFGSSPEDDIRVDPAPDVNFIYTGTPVGEIGGWVAIVTSSSYDKLLNYLTGPLSKSYEFDFLILNQTGGDSDTNMVNTMVPFGSWED